MRKSPLYFRSIVAAFIGLAMSLFSVSAFAAVDQFKPGGVAVATIAVKALPNNDGHSPEPMVIELARMHADTVADVRTQSLSLERGKQASARPVSTVKMYCISADRGDAVRKWIEGVRA